MRYSKILSLCVLLGCAQGVETPHRPFDAGINDANVTPETIKCADKIIINKEPPSVLIVMDKSGSMAFRADPVDSGLGSVWNATVPVILDSVEKTESRIKWGLEFFPSDGGCGTRPPVVDPRLSAYKDIFGWFKIVLPDGSTPTSEALKEAVAFFDFIKGSETKYILLATDGSPNCNSSAMAEPDLTYEAIKDAVTHGIHVIVVGISANDEDKMQLSVMAELGMEPNTTGSEKYYDTRNSGELADSLDHIVNSVALCSIRLKEKPIDITKMSVILGQDRVPRDTTHQEGWDITPDLIYINFYGSWCPKLQASNEVIISNNCGTF